MRNVIIGIIALFAIIILVISAYLSPNDLAKCDETPSVSGSCQEVDAIVAISGGNTLVRADEAIELYKKGWAPIIVFSGAAADTSGPSNAEVMRTHAVDSGVPADQIVIETLAQTTKQNAERSKDIFDERNLRTIILVTSGYHQRRASLEFNARSEGDVAVINHPVASDPDWPTVWWLTPRGWWLASGELAKIAAFYGGGSR